MTFEEFLNCGRLKAKMPQYTQKKANAVALSTKVLQESENPYVAISGGKDSVAMAFIVDEAAKLCGKSFRLWTHISDASFPGTLETCQKVAEILKRPLDVYESENSAFDAVTKKKKQSFGKTGVFFESVSQYATDKDLAFVGVRASESKRRNQAAKVHGQIFYSKSMGDVTVCHPILWFRLSDVAATLFEYNAPIHPIYHKTTVESGWNALKEDKFIRLGYITSKDLLNKGTAVFLRLNYPEQFFRLAERWPEIRFWV